MTKEEIFERIIDTFTDMGSECPEDTALCNYLTLKEGEMYLAQQRSDEDDEDLDPEDRLPDEVTPELYTEAMNCWIRYCKYQTVRNRIIDWFEAKEPYEVYEWYCETVLGKKPSVLCMCDLDEDIDFPFDIEGKSWLGIIKLGWKSSKTFRPTDTFVKQEANYLVSTNRPFHDGWLPVEDMADYIMEHPEDRESMIWGVMGDETYENIFEWGL